MAVRIRMKKLGRTHRAFFRICAVDKRSPRDGRVLEELGTYDPMVPDTDARALLNGERIQYWLSVGAQPSEKVAVLIKKYGAGGTHADQQKAALEKRSAPKAVPTVGPAAPSKRKLAEEAAAAAAAEQSKAAAAAEQAKAAAAAEQAKAADAPAETAEAGSES